MNITLAARLAVLLIVTSLSGALLSLAAPAAATPVSADWLTYGYDTSRTGFNPLETTISPDNVANLQLRWSADVGGRITAQPLYASGVQVGGVARDLVYAGTELGDLVALDAATGEEIWRKSISAVAFICRGSVNDSWGITGAPALDRASHRIYVAGASGCAYAFDLASGELASGWPVTLTKPTLNEHIWSAVAVYNGKLYVATSSHCDKPTYYGRIMAVDTRTATVVAQFSVVKTSSPGFGGGIWSYGGMAINPRTGRIFTATGNSVAAVGNLDYANQVLKLDPSLHLVEANDPGIDPDPLQDLDFGGTPVLFQGQGCPEQFVVTNKNRNLYIYKQSSVSGGPVQTIRVQMEGPLRGNDAYWPVGQIVYSPVPNKVGQPAGIVANKLGSDCRLTKLWNAALLTPPPQAPFIMFSSVTTANGVAYVATGDNLHVYGLDARSGDKLWTVKAAGSIYAPPIVVNGHVYVASWDQHVYAYGLSGEPDPTPTPEPIPTPAPGSNNDNHSGDDGGGGGTGAEGTASVGGGGSGGVVGAVSAAGLIGAEPGAADTLHTQLFDRSPVVTTADGVVQLSQGRADPPVLLTLDPVNLDVAPGPAAPDDLIALAAANLQLVPLGTPNNVTLTFKYSREDLALRGRSEGGLRVFYYFTGTGQWGWVELPTAIDGANGTVSVPNLDVSAFAAELTRVQLVAPRAETNAETGPA